MSFFLFPEKTPVAPARGLISKLQPHLGYNALQAVLLGLPNLLSSSSRFRFLFGDMQCTMPRCRAFEESSKQVFACILHVTPGCLAYRGDCSIECVTRARACIYVFCPSDFKEYSSCLFSIFSRERNKSATYICNILIERQISCWNISLRSYKDCAL